MSGIQWTSQSKQVDDKVPRRLWVWALGLTLAGALMLTPRLTAAGVVLYYVASGLPTAWLFWHEVQGGHP